jgi:WD40 repeat protein
MFVLVNQKIEVDSVYDNVKKHSSKARCANAPLPTKLEKGNLPVTFHKQIKSSGYSVAPQALKYTSKEKKKKEEGKSTVVWTISKDFYSKALPMTI